MDSVIRVSLFVVAGYVLVVGLAYLFQRSLLYFPSQNLPTPAQVGLGDARSIEVTTADGLTLIAWHVPAAAGRPTVVLFHGNGGNMADRAFKARALAAQGYGVLLSEYRGYGGNPGTPSEQGLYADARAVMGYLHGRGLDAGQIILHGESLGTGVAVKMAAESGGAALVLESPYTSVADVAARHYPYLPVRLLIKDRFPSADIIGNLHMPVLVVHGEADTVIPVRYGRALLDRANDPKEGVFLPGVGHNDLWQRGGGGAVLAFLHRLFGQ